MEANEWERKKIIENQTKNKIDDNNNNRKNSNNNP